mmetsp:Transcript_85473/g.217907  ORF Transcript_85473/g.217907 Transcript_85473/m.217907 type:complete len:239 (-) Transcript_85473:7-723(-)
MLACLFQLIDLQLLAQLLLRADHLDLQSVKALAQHLLHLLANLLLELLTQPAVRRRCLISDPLHLRPQRVFVLFRLHEFLAKTFFVCFQLSTLPFETCIQCGVPVREETLKSRGFFLLTTQHSPLRILQPPQNCPLCLLRTSPGGRCFVGAAPDNAPTERLELGVPIPTPNPSAAAHRAGGCPIQAPGQAGRQNGRGQSSDSCQRLSAGVMMHTTNTPETETRAAVHGGTVVDGCPMA